MNIEKILIVADDGTASAKAIRYGFNLARDIGAKVLILSVIEPESAAGNPDAGVFPDDALVRTTNRTDKFLRQAEQDYGQGVETELSIKTGEIVPVIVRVIHEWEVSLVITGTHGRTGISKLFSGSVAESIVRHSTVPVLVVPMDK